MVINTTSTASTMASSTSSSALDSDVSGIDIDIDLDLELFNHIHALISDVLVDDERNEDRAWPFRQMRWRCRKA